MISIFRMLLIAPVVWALLEGRFDLALWLFVIAGLSDAADGIVAKRFAWQSELGGRLDPVADKMLLVACFVTLWWLELVPLWLLLAVFARDLVIVVGVAIYHHRFERISSQPSVLSKINTFAQIICVLLVVFAAAHGGLEPVLLQTWFAITLMTTVFSGVNYLWTWSWRAWRVHEGRR